MIPILTGIAPLAPQYRAFIVDLWGVVHDGLTPYPGVVDALRRMREEERKVCLLSNAPRRIAGIIRRLGEIGIPGDCYDLVMSSGEAAHQALAARADPFHAALGRRCLHVGPDRDNDVVEGIDVVTATDPAAADFVLATGPTDFDHTLADYVPVLEACARAGLPMLCANPDLVVRIGDKLAICAGTQAAYYEELGGRVFYHGKPHAPIYRRCFALLGAHPERDPILAIGDSFRTDIAGAANAGIDGLFVIGGIHEEELGGGPGLTVDPTRLSAAAAAHRVSPRAAIPHLVW